MENTVTVTKDGVSYTGDEAQRPVWEGIGKDLMKTMCIVPCVESNTKMVFSARVEIEKDLKVEIHL